MKNTCSLNIILIIKFASQNKIRVEDKLKIFASVLPKGLCRIDSTAPFREYPGKIQSCII